ncbi:hypothetical protein [Hyphomicrobium facile]|uniref:Uncharacterized protein n=1 Tax=Hyphomicrobium facile TaxID=51670 RepID=A0A1I7NE45_9HYPH|nr:hypothetical protein [Hyphomicrobium facile]SFV32911.1 hypothetical protein SAMN04488557_1770 [Hyphomicrobium facile]
MPTKLALEFNARFVPPAKVAASFVEPNQFDDVASMNHNIIIGPRGSGKTTLLKMLTISALENWRAPGTDQKIREIEFNSAFIASDQVWSEQLANASTEEDEWGRAAFYTHTVLALINAIHEAANLGRKGSPDYLSHLAFQVDSELEATFVQMVAQGLRIDVPATTFLGLEVALRSYLGLMDPRNAKTRNLSAIPFSNTSDFFNSLSLILDVINGLIGQPHRRWGLLFDEIEIAPQHIGKLLFKSLRSFDPRFIIKMAFWPYMSELSKILQSSTIAKANHDYKVVSLSYAHKNDTDAFSATFAEHILRKLNVTRSEFHEIFGTSVFEKGRTRYSASTGATPQTAPDIFEELASKDPSFKAYYNSKRLGRKSRLTENESAALVRKVLPVVVMRNFYLQHWDKSSNDDLGRAKQRSRKSPSLYAGYPSIIQLADGNPRTLLILLTPLAKALEQARESNAKARLSVPLQNIAIETASSHVQSLLLATPVSLQGPLARKGLPGLVDVIGDRLAARLLGEHFDPDYVGSFMFDKSLPPTAEEAIGEALNAGAIIYVPETGVSPDSILEGLTNKRFRISYTLCPRYKLPLILGRQIALSNLLSEAAQEELFAER